LAGLAALLALLLGGAVPGQSAPGPDDPKKPAEDKKPSQLEELLAQALRDNPDVRVAEAKVRGAEAELNRTRLQVIQKVVAHQHTVETLTAAVRMAEANYMAAQAKLNAAETDYKRLAELVKRATIAQAELDAGRAKLDQARADLEAAKAALQAAKADLAKAQAELPYLLGKGAKDDKDTEAVKRALEWLKKNQGQAGPVLNEDEARALYELALTDAHRAWKAAQLPQGTVAEKLRKALDAPLNLKVEEAPVGDVLDYIQQRAGVPIVDTLPRNHKEKKLTLRLDNITLGAAFQLLGDVAGVQFAVRDYGILVTDKLPSGVMPLHDFWKGGDKKPQAPAEDKK
jgi:hypothetical protein